MKSVDLISKGLERVFSGEDCRVKHIGLFAMAGITSLISTNFRTISEAYRNAHITPNFGEIVVELLIFILISTYIGGYTLQFMHNVHHNEELPNFDGKPILAILKSVPLAIVWFIYFAVIIFGVSSLFAGVPGHVAIFYIVLALLPVFLIYIPFCYIFVWVAFSKNFDAKGLFNPFGAFKYLKAFGIVLAVFICMFVLNIIAFIPIGIVGGIIGFLGEGTKVASYIGGIMGGYIGYVGQFILAYCLVQIYKEKFEQQEY